MTLLGELERNTASTDRAGVLRFITAGSVDDGKSTLIGRLLHDTRAIFQDQLAAVARVSSRRGQDHPDLSLLTDGLEAEREQGITIDVAYRYFSTPRRKFIIADTPGHEQYTRNMVTGASTADAAVILVDARKGILTQTRRHACLAQLLGVRHILVAVNKMDLVGYDEQVFERIRGEFTAFCAQLGISGARFIPMSALRGDMVADRGSALAWYRGPTLLAALEATSTLDDAAALPMRFPIQMVIRPGAGSDFRGYAGRLESGTLVPGSEVLALPSGRRTIVRDIVSMERSLPAASAGDSIIVILGDDIDLGRGDQLADPDSPPRTSKRFGARLCWLSSEPFAASLPGSPRFILKHTTRSVKASIAALDYRVDVNTLERQPAPASLAMNDIARVTIALAQPVFLDAYDRSRATGAFILIDASSNQTVAAGMADD